MDVLEQVKAAGSGLNWMEEHKGRPTQHNT